jgi:predicted DNA binding CopG/RHH family protein
MADSLNNTITKSKDKKQDIDDIEFEVEISSIVGSITNKTKKIKVRCEH